MSAPETIRVTLESHEANALYEALLSHDGDTLIPNGCPRKRRWVSNAIDKLRLSLLDAEPTGRVAS